jgi:glutathione S-transferase
VKPQFFYHPFSSYCQKVLIALYEKQVDFNARMLDQDHAENGAEFARRWPIGRFPILVDGDRTIMETSAIIEHLEIAHSEPRLIPADPREAVEVRMLDRIFDNYVMNSASNPVFNAIRPETDRDLYGVNQAMAMLDKTYAWLDQWLEGREWAAAGQFSLADCAAAPSLFYADWVRPIPEEHANLRAYRARLLARPSFARAVDGGRPYRHFFPLGAPDRD